MTTEPQIREEHFDATRHLKLLLMGDESEEMIARYISRATLLVACYNNLPVAVCAITREPADTIEIKNLAVDPQHRQRGLGRRLLSHVEHRFPQHTIMLGTGETPSTLRFYHNCGYRYSHRIERFFTDNYPHPIIEEGVTLCDMIYLVKKP